MFIKQDESGFSKFPVKSHNMLCQSYLLFSNGKYIYHNEWSSNKNSFWGILLWEREKLIFSSFLPVTFNVVVVNVLYNTFRVGALYMHTFCIF